MTTLNLYIILLMLTAILFVLVPVLRFRNKGEFLQSEKREQQNIEVFQQSVSELDNNLADNLIEMSEYEKLKLELERNFLNDMESGKIGKEKAATSYTKIVPLVLMIFIPLSSFLIYRSIGSGPDLVLPELIEELNASESVDDQITVLNEIAAILDQRYQRRDGDIQTGYTLGTLYISLEEYANAVRVFSKLAESIEEDLDKAAVLGQLAQSQYLLADSTLTPTVQASIDQALLLNSNEQAIMSILAVEALLAEDLPAAANYWRRQVSQLPVGSEQIAQLNERIATIEAYINEPEEGSENIGNIESSTANAVELSVTVSLDDSILQQIEPGMTVFIFARSEGTPPLAAVTVSPEELPITVTLNDSMAMLPQFNLSSVQTAYVGASIARQAVAESGDFQVLSETFVIAEQQDPIILSIKDRLP